MLIKDSLDEMKKREVSLEVIKSIIDNSGRNSLYDLTGLSGGFLANQEELNLLETYIGPAIFDEKLQTLGKAHLGGEKIFAVNRTTSGILATILAIVKKDNYVVHFLPELPSHPSIPRSCTLVGANYLEFDDIGKLIANFPKDVSLVVITGSTMDHKVISEDIFLKIINIAKKNNITVLVDDASGARLRTSIFKQKKAIDLGADLVITSTDKLMDGPRGGIIAGSKILVDKIKVKANEFGLEAQGPSILAMANALKKYNGKSLINSISKKDNLLKLLENDFSMFKSTPTGIMIQEDDLANEVRKCITNFEIYNKDLNFVYGMILLKKHGIITIPAVSMPGASNTIRFDMSSKDGQKIEIKVLYDKIVDSFNELLEVVDNNEKCREILFNP